MLTVDFARMQFRPRQRVLDLGCGEGRHVHGLSWHHPELLVVGVDINSRDVRTAQQRHQPPAEGSAASCFFAVADGFGLPFPSACFDQVICSEVLEHVHDYPKLLAEIHRVLKPGGKLAMSVPRAWPERICWRLSRAYHQVAGGHVRIFNATQLRRQIERTGFQFTERHWAHALHSPYWWLRCLLWRDDPQAWIVRLYHRLLVWDLMQKPRITRTLERLLNPLAGKSVVMYFTKDHPTF